MPKIENGMRERAVTASKSMISENGIENIIEWLYHIVYTFMYAV